MANVAHGYRTGIGAGFPDCVLIRGDRHSLVELKLLEVGPTGDKKLSGLFKAAQPPWYMGYLSKGGTRLFVVFKLNKGYGLLHVSEEFVRHLGTARYSQLPQFDYREFKTLKNVLEALEA